jgi:mRNA-degrading endonuclease RelE of RelBE toxin-antitoxin system
MHIKELPTFSKTAKKLHKNQKEDLHQAIRAIVDDTNIGKLKIGDLAGIWVYKFKMVNNEALIAYTYNPDTDTLTLLALGYHENFYRDLK